MNPASSMPNPYPSPGEVVDGKYQIEKILGEGGMGMVARAYHRVLHAPVALKFMNPQFMTFPGAVERFINEGKASSLIKSDHIVPVTDAGKLDTGAPFLVMECLEGMDLADLLHRDGTPGLPVERAIHFVVQVLRGLQAAHAIGIIHRDMKPSNCFVVNKDGEDDFVKILDFGISKVQQPGSASLTQTNSALGTPLYMSPEQARSPRDVDARSDLYSVGVILYELLTGHTPFSSESGEFTEILFKLFTADPPPIKSTRPDIPDELAAVVHKALARETADRHESALALAEALAPFGSERSKHIVTRMRGFKAPAKGSVHPPEMLPSSMVAFSQLDRAPATDVMANRPTTDVMKSPPVTALMEEAPGRVPPRMRSDPSHGYIAAAPELAEARARPEEAGARTQFDSISDHAKKPDTDLGAAREVSQMTAQPEQKRSPMVFALLAIVMCAIGGGAFALYKTSGGTKPDPSTTVATIAPPPAVSVIPSAPVSAAVTPSVSVATSAPSVASSAPTIKPPPTQQRPGTSSGNNTSSGSPNTSSGALNTQPHLN